MPLTGTTTVKAAAAPTMTNFGHIYVKGTVEYIGVRLRRVPGSVSRPIGAPVLYRPSIWLPGAGPCYKDQMFANGFMYGWQTGTGARTGGAERAYGQHVIVHWMATGISLYKRKVT